MVARIRGAFHTVEGKRRIDRKDWGVTWNTTLDSGGLLVSDKIILEFELFLIKEQSAARIAARSGQSALRSVLRPPLRRLPRLLRHSPRSWR